MLNSPEFPAVPVLLVDGDIIAYRCAAAAEKTKYLVCNLQEGYLDVCEERDTAKEAKAVQAERGGIIWSRKELEPVEHALTNVATTMEAIATKWTSAITEVYLSGERNFRDGVWVTKKYKGNRETPKPTHLNAVRDYLKDKWFARVASNQEADDDVGIASARDQSSSVIVTTDKDLDQLPGWHYNWVDGTIYWVTPENAAQFLWEQVISGDATDNIPGLPGWGPVKARKYMDEFYAHEASIAIGADEIVYDLYVKEGFDRAYFDEQFNLIRILQVPRKE